MRIGEVAKKAGASVRSIRHYEQAGLIRASRGSNGYRDFGADAVLTVRRIARMIRLGFGATEIATFLNCIVDDPAEVTACESVAAAHREKLAEIERLIADLEARRKTLLATLRAASGPTPLPETPHAKLETAPAPLARRLDPGRLLRRRG